MSEKKLTSFCGLYCLDCIPSNKCFFEAVNKFEKSLAQINFENYAHLKSESIIAFRKYPEFKVVLREIKKLECKASCRENGGKVNCNIRNCAINKKYEGCWECNDFKNCNLLLPIKKVHPRLDYNLELIKKNGVENWVSKRGKHYEWSQT